MWNPFKKKTDPVVTLPPRRPDVSEMYRRLCRVRNIMAFLDHYHGKKRKEYISSLTRHVSDLKAMGYDVPINQHEFLEYLAEFREKMLARGIPK